MTMESSKRSYVVPNDYMNKVLNHERGLEKGFAKVMHSCVDFTCAKTIALHLNKATLYSKSSSLEFWSCVIFSSI
jgi:hypothetical protein